jgi:hypothetical protein
MGSDVIINATSVEVMFTTGDYGAQYHRRAEENKGNTIFSFRSPYRYNNNLKITETRAVDPIRQNQYGAAYAGAIDGKMEANYRLLYAMYNKYRDDNDLKPSEAKAKIIGDLNKSLKNCLDLEISGIGNVEGSQGTLYFSKPDHPHEFEFNVLSYGEK